MRRCAGCSAQETNLRKIFILFCRAPSINTKVVQVNLLVRSKKPKLSLSSTALLNGFSDINMVTVIIC